MRDLGRRFILDVTQSGHVFIRERGERITDGGLPVFVTHTLQEAKDLQVRHCRLARDGSGLYQLNEFRGEWEDLDLVSTLFRESCAGDPWGAEKRYRQALTRAKT